MAKVLVVDPEREVTKKKLYDSNTPGKAGDSKFYAIARGKTTGVVKGWDLAEPKILDCKKKVCFKAFDDEASAWAWLGDSKKKLQRKYKKTRKVTKTRPLPGGKKGEEEEYETDEEYFSYEDSSEEEVGKAKPKRPPPPPKKVIDEKNVNTSWMGSQKFTTDKQWLVEEEEKLVEEKKEVELAGTAVAKAYEIGQTLGSGGYSVVKLGKGKEQVALKILSSQMDPSFSVEKGQNEVAIIKSAKHPNIVSFVQSFVLNDAVVIALELLEGGELLQTLNKRQNHSEDSARLLISQLVSAVDYLHQNGIVHRDLVPENILFTKGEQSIKLVGFSVATKFTPGQNISFDGVVGTPALQPPEIIQRKDFNQSVDVWSIGILTYVLLSGYFPFQDSNVMRLNMKIRKAEFEFPDAEFNSVSEAGKNFVKDALKVEGRPSSSSLKSSAWLTKENNKKALPTFAANLQNTVQSNAWNN